MLEKENIEHTPEKERKWHNNSRTKVQTIVNLFCVKRSRSSGSSANSSTIEAVTGFLSESLLIPANKLSIYNKCMTNLALTVKLSRSSSISTSPGHFTCVNCHETKHWRRLLEKILIKLPVVLLNLNHIFSH